MIFYTKSTRHFAAHIKQEGLSTIKQFSDGELFVRIDQSVKNKKVWIVASTQSPAEHMLELFFLLDALQRNGAYINLLITYFAYGRQVIAREGEACTAQVISTLLKTFTIGDTYIIHPHSVLLHDFLPFAAVDTIDFFCNQAVNYDAIAAPDKGALDLAQHIASRCNKELIVLTKTRPDHEKVEIKAIEGNVKNKKILLIDDIISTGRTIAQAVGALKHLGASSISAAATHGIFAPGSIELLEHSDIQNITVTNTIAQNPRGKINVVDISPLIQKTIRD